MDRWKLIIMPLLALFAHQLSAQETRMGEQGFESPPATIGQMDWLVGQWLGTGIGGAPAQESWLPPVGPTMVGTFVQADATGAIRFTEHLYLAEEDGTLVLRLKHFNADLTGWEEKGDMLTFRLVAVEPCAAYFHALTLRCADPDDPGSGIVAAVRMKSDKPEPQELVFRFDAAGKSSPSRCPDAMTTLDINKCFAGVLARADERRARYLAAALERHEDRPELVAKIAASDAVFIAYREAECDAVLEDWMEGSVRGFMTLSCKVEMTDNRSHAIWQNWLTYMDSTPPLLPEPGPIE
ncbi:MAG: DUF1311 domain-containing protein [Erythrobacter sp.]|nr:DUF1311 domain-containing protein [Erythrobacter sp.]